MSVSNPNNARHSIFERLRKFSAGKKRHGRSSKSRERRDLQVEGLEERSMFSVSSLWFSGNMLVVGTDNASTSVTVSQVGSNIRISEVGTNRMWDYSASQVGSVEFQGGAGNDRFVNNVANLPVRGFGGAGNDYLEGYNGNDTFYGGDGHDTLIGYGGIDELWGGNGNDVLRGMAGNDRLRGDYGDDHIDGGADNDVIWAGDGADILLGGYGNDQLIGGYGNDRLNGQAGIDQMWGEAGNDVLISIDSAFGEYVDGGADSDILWIDRVGSSQDSAVAVTSSDIVQGVAYFANGADRTLDGDNLLDPSDSGTKVRFNNVVKSDGTHAGNTQGSNPLFSSSGPRLDDVTQGSVGDCWLLSGLGAISLDNPHAMRQNVADFDDGTYGVRLGNNFYRVDNELPVWNAAGGATTNNLRFAELGAQNSMWVAVVEKAFAHYRRGANTYASLDGGWSIEVNRAFRSASAGARYISSYSSAAALVNDIAYLWNNYQAVTIGFVGTLVGNVPLIANHMYTVSSILRNSAGTITGITLRNPHGNNTTQFGMYVTLTPDQIWAQRSGGGQVNWGRV